MTQVQGNIRGEPTNRPNILLMEDEFSVAKGLEMVMREEGYEVELADTGQKALTQFSVKDYDLLLADLRLPDMDGMEVVRHVRENRPQTPVVIITGYPSVATATQAVKMGVSDYLRKPFSDDEIKAAVEKALRQKREESMEALITETQKERLIQKEEVLRVLNRANQDQEFWTALMEKGSEALKDFRLSRKAKAAIVSGDLEWLRKNIGDLTEEQLRFIHKRLEREAW